MHGASIFTTPTHLSSPFATSKDGVVGGARASVDGENPQTSLAGPTASVGIWRVEASSERACSRTGAPRENWKPRISGERVLSFATMKKWNTRKAFVGSML